MIKPVKRNVYDIPSGVLDKINELVDAVNATDKMLQMLMFGANEPESPDSFNCVKNLSERLDKLEQLQTDMDEVLCIQHNNIDKLEQQHKEHVHEATFSAVVLTDSIMPTYTLETSTPLNYSEKPNNCETGNPVTEQNQVVKLCENCKHELDYYGGRIGNPCTLCGSENREHWTPKEPVCDTPPNDKMFCEWTYKQVPVDKEWHSLMMSVKRDTEDNFSVKNVVILSDDYIDELVPLYKHNEVITQMIKYREVIQEVYQLAKENNKGLCSASSACETIRSKLEVYVQ